MNIVVLGGNLTRDPELRYIASGTAVVNFSVAINHYFKKSDGEKGKKTVFIDCEAWDTGAENLNTLFKKGDEIYVEGTIESRSWETEDGGKRSKTFVRVNNFHRTFGKRSSSDEDSTSNSSVSNETAAEPQDAREMSDEIPF